MCHLVSRAELNALLGFSRSSFFSLKSRNHSFPQPQGVKKNMPLYSLDEMASFLLEHAPTLLTKTPEGMKLAARLMHQNGNLND